MPLIVFITGCSSGIGLTTAVTLATDPNKRFLVYATILKPYADETRFQDEVSGKEVLDLTLFPIQMDVTSDASVEDAVSMVMRKEGRIDILVNNAGLALINVTEMTTMKQAKLVFEVNFFGTFRVIRQVLPGMKKQKSGRIINMSSDNGIFSSPYIGVYAASKHAIEAISQETAIIGRFHNIWVSTIEPGPVDTAIRDSLATNGMGGLDDILTNPDINDLDKRIASGCWTNEFEFNGQAMQQPEEIAAIVLEAATAEKPHFRYQSSKAVQGFAKVMLADTTGDSCVEYQVNLMKRRLKNNDEIE